MIEFTGHILQKWKKEKIRFLVTEEMPCADVNQQVTQFTIYPFKSEHDVEDFILHKTRGTPFSQQEIIISYDIANPEVFEMANGVPYCKYYLNLPPPEKNER